MKTYYKIVKRKDEKLFSPFSRIKVEYKPNTLTTPPVGGGPLFVYNNIIEVLYDFLNSVEYELWECEIIKSPLKEFWIDSENIKIFNNKVTLAQGVYLTRKIQVLYGYIPILHDRAILNKTTPHLGYRYQLRWRKPKSPEYNNFVVLTKPEKMDNWDKRTKLYYCIYVPSHIKADWGKTNDKSYCVPVKPGQDTASLIFIHNIDWK